MEMEQDPFDTERFIDEIEKRRALWDLESPDYKNRVLKRSAWEEVVDIFSKTESTVEEKKQLVVGRPFCRSFGRRMCTEPFFCRAACRRDTPRDRKMAPYTFGGRMSGRTGGRQLVHCRYGSGRCNMSLYFVPSVQHSQTTTKAVTTFTVTANDGQPGGEYWCMISDKKFETKSENRSSCNTKKA
ncbi:hypothetical protein J6590_006804 [Homalodisca vitripennis]|nr:hypothetical protein J6590_006804 [Homalodisca vitripennis]